MGHNHFKSKPGEEKSPTVAKRRYMGVTLITLNPQLILELQMRGNDLPADVTSGVLIWKVVLGSPAHQYVFIFAVLKRFLPLVLSFVLTDPFRSGLIVEDCSLATSSSPSTDTPSKSRNRSTSSWKAPTSNWTWRWSENGRSSP